MSARHTIMPLPHHHPKISKAGTSPHWPVQPLHPVHLSHRPDHRDTLAPGVRSDRSDPPPACSSPNLPANGKVGRNLPLVAANPDRCPSSKAPFHRTRHSSIGAEQTPYPSVAPSTLQTAHHPSTSPCAHPTRGESPAPLSHLPPQGGGAPGCAPTNLRRARRTL